MTRSRTSRRDAGEVVRFSQPGYRKPGSGGLGDNGVPCGHDQTRRRVKLLRQAPDELDGRVLLVAALVEPVEHECCAPVAQTIHEHRCQSSIDTQPELHDRGERKGLSVS